MEPTRLRLRNVTTIVRDLNPTLENYFDASLRLLPMIVRQVHESSEHGPMVVISDAHSHMGMFYNFLIRKEFYNLMGEEAMDSRSCRVLKRLLDLYNLPRDTYNLSSDSESESEDDDEEEYHADAEEPLKSVLGDAKNDSKDREKNECSIDVEKPQKSVLSNADDESEDDNVEIRLCPVDFEEVQKLARSYQRFKDPKNATIDIIEDIFHVATLHAIFFDHPLKQFHPDLLNMDNIRTVLKHVASFDRSNIVLNPAAGGKYFAGDAHYMLDDIIFQINTSVRPFRVKNSNCRRRMYQTLLYALGFFVNEGKEIRKFKIYNPLLGLEYFYELPELNFNEFQALVEQLKPL